MTDNEKYFVELTRAAVFDDIPYNKPENADWQYIFDKAAEQNVSGLVYCAISKLNSDKPSAEMMQKWQNIMLSTISVNAKRYNEFLRMNKLLSDAGIKLIGLKGCVLRSIYPVPELRTMGDFDVLVKQSCISDVADIFKKNMYKVKNDCYGIVCEGTRAYWEVFYTIEEEFRINPDKCDEKFFANTITDFDNKINFPDYTYMLLHLIVHTGKHCIREGAGIRNLCDIALLISKHKEQIDFATVKSLCAEQNFSNIYSYIISAVKDWYDIDVLNIDTEYRKSEKFMEYILLNGIYGKSGNTMISQVAKHEDDTVSGMRKMFFPTLKMLDYRYKYLKKYPFLLPLAWIHRVFSAMFRWKYSIGRMARDMKDAVEFSDDRQKWLKELGLEDRH